MHADLGSGVPHGYFLAEYYAPIPGVAAGQSKIFLQVLTKEKNARKSGPRWGAASNVASV
jgi:hypothetical protein